MSEAAPTIFPNLGSAGRADFATPPLQRDAARSRYSPTTRILAGTLIGVVASVLIIGSMQVGAGIAFHENGNNEWGPLMWGQHWAWRGAWGLVATCLAAFLGGLASRDRGKLVGVLGALPSAAWWAFVTYFGWVGHFPSGSVIEVPIGYRLAATFVLLATLPIAATAGELGSDYGAANGEHFDSTRGALFGIKWYHYVWLPILIHALIVQTTWSAMYSFDWFAASWRYGPSIFSLLPAMFTFAMFTTLGIMGKGAFRTYEALAGFESTDTRSTGKRVLVYGIGYPLGAAAAQTAISLLHFGLSKLFSS